MCLKYNLWLSVWEDQGHASKKSKKSRTTYFYWYDSSKELVDCKEFQGDYIHLPFQSHILYIWSSFSTHFGYWNQDQINPFTYPDLFNYSDNLLCKYSYLDDPLKSKVMNLFKNYLNMKIISDEDGLYSWLNFHGNNINPTLVPLLFSKVASNFQQHGLLVVYPFDEEESIFLDVSFIMKFLLIW